jgi:hypothetical protein
MPKLNLQYSPGGNFVSLVTKNRLAEVSAAIATGSGTASQTVFGSSLFLEALYIPAQMRLSEVDMAFSFSFSTSATTSTYGSMNRSFAIYSYVNASTLSSVFSTTQGIAFGGSSTTQGAQTAMSQVAGGWTATGGVIVPMTFASTLIPPGEYVMGNLVAFSVASSATASMYGVALGLMTSSTLAVVQSNQLSVASMLTAPGAASVLSNSATLAKAAFTAFTVAPTVANVLSSSAIVSFPSGIHFASLTYAASANIIASATGGTLVGLGAQTAAQTMSFASLAGSYLSASVSGAVLSNAGTAAIAAFTGFTAAPVNATVLSSSGLTAGSYISNTTWGNAITSITLVTTAGAFNYLGASSSMGGGLSYSPFFYGLMSTGAIPVAITLTTGTTAGLTTYGSTAALQPWWGLVGQ